MLEFSNMSVQALKNIVVGKSTCLFQKKYRVFFKQCKSNDPTGKKLIETNNPQISTQSQLTLELAVMSSNTEADSEICWDPHSL